MKNSIKAWIIFRRILIILFIIFLIIYFQAENNNYTTKKTILTEEKIKEFEKDVKNGEFIDIKKYTEEDIKDTSNYMSDIGYSLGEEIGEFFSVKVVNFFEFISQFVS